MAFPNVHYRQRLGSHSQVPHLNTKAQAEEPMVHTTLNPHTLFISYFYCSHSLCEWYPQKVMNHLCRAQGGGSDTIHSPYFIDLELRYNNSSALQQFSKGGSSFFTFLAFKILQNYNLEMFGVLLSTDNSET